MFQKKKKCDVCGYRFAPTKEAVYTAEEPRSMTECLTKAPTRFSATDCPRCGCQIALAIRVPRVDCPSPLKPDESEGNEVAENED